MLLFVGGCSGAPGAPRHSLCRCPGERCRPHQDKKNSSGLVGVGRRTAATQAGPGGAIAALTVFFPGPATSLLSVKRKKSSKQQQKCRCTSNEILKAFETTL